MNWDVVKAALESLVYRGKVIAAVVKGRTLLQVTGLDQDTYNNVELLLPPGYVALPAAMSDIVIMQVGAFGSHKFCIAGDNTADAVTNLQSGDTGFSRGGLTGQVFLLKNGYMEAVTPKLVWGPTEQALKRLVQEEFVALFNAHTHGEGPVPDQQMNATHLTGGS
jgi:phage gp45-like